MTSSQEAGPAVPATPEDVKRSSAHLRGDLSSELTDRGDRFSADSTVLLKFHGIYQQDDRDQRRARTQQRQPLAYSCMVRTSVPGGVLTAEQWLAMDGLADKVGDGTLRITTRQGIQFHFVDKRDLRPARRDPQRAPGHHHGRLRRRRAQRRRPARPRTADRRQDELLAAAAAQLAARFRPQTGAYYELWLDGEQAVTPVEPRAAPTAAAPPEEPSRSTATPTCPASSRSASPGRATTASTSTPRTSASCPTTGGYVVLVGGGLGMSHAREDDTYPRLATPLGWVRRRAARRGRRGDRHHPARLRQPRATATGPASSTRSTSGASTGSGPRSSAGSAARWTGPRPAGRGTARRAPRLVRARPTAAGSSACTSTAAGCATTATSRQRTALREIVERYGPEVRLTARQDVLLCGVDEA